MCAQGVNVPFVVGSSIPQVPLALMLSAAAQPSSSHAGQGTARQGREGMVVEADEYGGAFLGLNPAVAIVSSVDLDHVDIYEYGPPRAKSHTVRTDVSDCRLLRARACDKKGHNVVSMTGQ